MSAVADPNIKQVRLVPSGGAESMLDEEGGQTRKRGGHGGGRGRGAAAAKTFKIGTITKEGGGSTSPGTMTQLAASHVPGGAAAAATAVGVDSALTQKGAPVGGGSTAAATAPAATPLKVVLAAPKKKGKVILAAAAAPKAGSVAHGVGAPAGSTHGKTRKHRGGARKIKVSMSSLSKKIHRAKTIRSKATDDSIDVIKKNLHKAGLIKAESKAPEPILRQMYADFLTLKSRAL